MFGQPMKTSSRAVPPWMSLIRDEVSPGTVINWFPSRVHCYGCANVRGGNCIELHTSDDGSSTPSAIMVLLHELAHVQAPWSSPNVQNIRSGYHGIKFWMKAQALYSRYGQLDFASRNDGYKCGRDFMVKILECKIDDVFTTPDGSVWQLDFAKGTAEFLRFARTRTVMKWDRGRGGVGRYRKVKVTDGPGRHVNPVKLIAREISIGGVKLGPGHASVTFKE